MKIMDKIIECVPNFSTSDSTIISEITKEIKSTPNVKLLNVEPDEAYNRVVVTFVGTPENVGEAAFKALAKATQLIDMTSHQGEHPRLGACDVTPFVPVKGTTIEECVSISKRLAEHVATKLGVPTYLYGKAAQSEDRFKLSDIRKGQYEGLTKKILDPIWKPDFGEAKFNKKSGAYVIGVRDFLIAYNVNVDEEENVVAKEIAVNIRESGQVVEKDGEKVRIPGKFKGIQGMGFPLEKDGRKLTQVSMNVVDYKNKTTMHTVFDEVKAQAEAKGVQVTGSEIVGLVPLEAIIMAGKHYSHQETDQAKLIEIAIARLGLSDLEKFVPERKIIELMINQDLLVDLSLSDFLADLASTSPAPGGGSVSAFGAALAASLLSMVANLTIGKEKYQLVDEEMKLILDQCLALVDELSLAVDEDTKAFNQVMASFKLSKDEPERRSKAIQEAMTFATEVPLQVAETAKKLIEFAKSLAQRGNSNAISDVGVAVLFVEAAIKGALFNVKINLGSITDQDVIDLMKKKVEEIMNDLAKDIEEVMNIVNKQIE